MLIYDAKIYMQDGSIINVFTEIAPDLGSLLLAARKGDKTLEVKDFFTGEIISIRAQESGMIMYGLHSDVNP